MVLVETLKSEVATKLSSEEEKSRAAITEKCITRDAKNLPQMLATTLRLVSQIYEPLLTNLMDVLIPYNAEIANKLKSSKVSL